MTSDFGQAGFIITCIMPEKLKFVNYFDKISRINPSFIPRGENGYPSTLSVFLDTQSPEVIYYLGNIDILTNNLVGLFCSVRCPGSLILQAYDLA